MKMFDIVKFMHCLAASPKIVHHGAELHVSEEYPIVHSAIVRPTIITKIQNKFKNNLSQLSYILYLSHHRCMNPERKSSLKSIR
jgi:hypothetical protein